MEKRFKKLHLDRDKTKFKPVHEQFRSFSSHHTTKRPFSFHQASSRRLTRIAWCQTTRRRSYRRRRVALQRQPALHESFPVRLCITHQGALPSTVLIGLRGRRARRWSVGLSFRRRLPLMLCPAHLRPFRRGGGGGRLQRPIWGPSICNKKIGAHILC